MKKYNFYFLGECVIILGLLVVIAFLIKDDKHTVIGRESVVEEALQEMIKVMPVVMYNMVQMFHATKIILTGKLIEYKDKFQEALLEEFTNYCDLKKTKVEFMEETKKAVYGAAMIAIRGAIDSIEV